MPDPPETVMPGEPGNAGSEALDTMPEVPVIPVSDNAPASETEVRSMPVIQASVPVEKDVMPVEEQVPVMESPAREGPVPEPNMPEKTNTGDNHTSDMPPPHFPASSMLPPSGEDSSSVIPAVNLLPPTPNTSQEVAISGPTTLLEVPSQVPPSSTPPPNSPRNRSRSRSPAVDPSQLRRSPRLGSPAPGAKRPASDILDAPGAKKPREQ